MGILVQLLIGLAGPISVMVASWFANRKLTVIHELVNSRLTEALRKIDALELKLYSTTGEKPTGEPPAVSPEIAAGLPGVPPRKTS